VLRLAGHMAVVRAQIRQKWWQVGRWCIAGGLDDVEWLEVVGSDQAAEALQADVLHLALLQHGDEAGG